MTRFLIILKLFVRGIGAIGRTCDATISSMRSRLSCSNANYGFTPFGHLFERVPVLHPEPSPSLGQRRAPDDKPEEPGLSLNGVG